METKFDMLSDVLPGRESWRFKVRLLRLWSIDSFMKPGEINSLKMVFIDEKVLPFMCFVLKLLMK
jgi:hypothetical protein